MEPDWNDAPTWANYFAQDEDGFWYWYEFEPRLGHRSWIPGSTGQVKRAEAVLAPSWQNTKQGRS